MLARRAGQKVIVFSQFSDTIAYVRSVLSATQRLRTSGLADGGARARRPRPQSEEIVALRDATVAITGDTEDRDDVVNAFAPFYRIGPGGRPRRRPPSPSARSSWTAGRPPGRAPWAAPIDVLLSSDVLAEGVNLQDAALLVNFDVHWNPVRMIQRSGRIDRRLNPRIEQPHEFPDLAALAAKLGKPVPGTTGTTIRTRRPVTVNMILPDELEAELQLRERIATKTWRSTSPSASSRAPAPRPTGWRATSTTASPA